jgi:hypothetical protein
VGNIDLEAHLRAAKEIRRRFAYKGCSCAYASNNQKNPALKSKPYVARRSHTNNPTPQNIATDLSVSISTWVPATRESTLAMAVICDLSKAAPSMGLSVRAVGSK